MAPTWRLLDIGSRPAADNMALDEVVLTARSRGQVPTTLRFLQFSPRCTLVGYHQAVEQEIRIPYCQVHGIEINRRLAGGGLFWDESQLGWEIYAAQDDPRCPKRAEALYSGGYGWLFPKSDTANVGVGVKRAMGADPRAALAHLLDRLELGEGAILGRTGGRVPREGW
jgi:lipoate-protein ligase A